MTDREQARQHRVTRERLAGLNDFERYLRGYNDGKIEASARSDWNSLPPNARVLVQSVLIGQLLDLMDEIDAMVIEFPGERNQYRRQGYAEISHCVTELHNRLHHASPEYLESIVVQLLARSSK